MNEVVKEKTKIKYKKYRTEIWTSYEWESSGECTSLVSDEQFTGYDSLMKEFFGDEIISDFSNFMLYRLRNVYLSNKKV